MITTYGSRVMTKPEGMLRAFRIDNLVRLDEETGDGRLLRSAGAGVRELPRTVYGGFEEGDPHGPNQVIGRLDAVEFDPDNNTATGWGWFLDDDEGRQAARYVATKALRHNSIHMTEIEITIEWASDDPSDPGFWDYTVIFEKFNVASTTMLGIPAFANSAYELDDELTASIYASEEPLVIDVASAYTFDAKLPTPTREVTADGSPKPPMAYFLRPEGAEPCPITVGEPDEAGFAPVWGNLARWNVCHDGFLDHCVVAPWSPDEYAGFNASTVLTSGGFVGTGPIFFEGGHPDRPIGNGDPAKAYGGIENAWADVRTTAGLHGPWIAGVVRPGVSDESIYAARASRISGHWAPDGRLLAIVSVNTPGNEVPRAKVWTDGEGNVLELVASYVPDCAPEAKPAATNGTYNVNVTWSDDALSLIQSGNLFKFAPAPSAEDELESVVDVADPVAVERYLAELDLEAEEDFDRGLV